MDNNIRCTNPECPDPTLKHTKAGLNWRNGKRNAQRFRCHSCGRVFVPKNNVEEVKNVSKTRK